MDPTKLKKDLRVFWKLMNLQDCVWEIRYRIIIKTILPEKERIHYSTTIWFTNFSYASIHQNSSNTSSSGQGIGKLEKISAWNLTKVRSRKEVIEEARTSDAKLEAKHQKYKGRVVLRGDTVKDDSGSYAVFTEQGSSASQMTAAKVIDIISRLPGCDGQAADAVSDYTQVKIEVAHKLLRIPKSECPDIWICLPRHKLPSSWPSIEDPVVLFERNLYGYPLAGRSWERQFEKILSKHRWEIVSKWECLFVHR